MLYLILPFYLSCSDDFSTSGGFDGEQIILGENMERVSLTFTQIYRTLKVVPLETSPDFVIGNIVNVKANEERILIRDDKSTLFLFDGDGNYINKIHIEGRGAFEAGSIRDIAFRRDTSSFYLLDGSSAKLLEVNYDGQIFKTIPLASLHGLLNLGITPDNNLLLYSPFSSTTTAEGESGLANSFAFLTPQGKVINKVTLPVPHNYTPIIQGAIINSSFGMQTIKTQFIDTIYKVDGSNLKPHLAINTGGKKIPDGDLSSLQRLKKMRGRYIQYDFHIENEHYIFAAYRYKNRRNKIVIDKKTGTYHHLDHHDDEANEVYNISGLTFGVGDNALRFFPNRGAYYSGKKPREIMHVSAEKFIEYQRTTNNKFPEYFEVSNPNRISQLKESDNQLILFGIY